MCFIVNSDDIITWTAYVAGEQEGLILEKPFLMGQALREGRHLDITSELNLIKETRREMKASNRCSEKTEKRTMKELGLKRSATNQSWANQSNKILVHLRSSLIFSKSLNFFFTVKYNLLEKVNG